MDCENSLPIVHLHSRHEFIFSVWFGFIAVMGTPLNILIVVLYVRTKHLQSYSNTLVFGDLITCAFLCPLSIAEMLGNSKQRCKIKIPAKYLTVLMSISALMLVSIAYYRYNIIKRPRNYHLKKWKKIFLVAFPWISPVFLVISKFAETSLNDYMVILTILSVYLTVAIFTHQMKGFLEITTTLTDVQKARNRKVVTLINLILLCSFLSGTIMFVHRVWRLLDNNHNIPLSKDDSALMRYAGRTLLATNSLINPFLYVFKHREFKKAAKLFLRRIMAYNNKRNKNDQKCSGVKPINVQPNALPKSKLSSSKNRHLVAPPLNLPGPSNLISGMPNDLPQSRYIEVEEF